MKNKKTTRPKQAKPMPSKKPPLWARLLAAGLSPIIFLGVVELVLALVGYGQTKGFFIPWKVQNQTFYLTNDHYCEHFVPKELSREPEACALEAKGDSTFRIFVLGGSAAFGDPEPAYGFCRQLEVLLNTQSPEMTFEIVNAAVTSMNSHVARRIAADCARLDPDLFIVYMGNNEVVGPYGPPTLPASLYASGTFVDLAIWTKKETRIGQLIANTATAARTSRGVEKKWMGMEAFLTSQITHDDPKMQSCYRHFERNLRDIVRTAHRSGAQTLVCTVPTNLRRCAPFASQHKAGLSADELAQWDGCFEAGRALERAGDLAGALAQYEQAHAIDPEYAELAYCMGQCLLALDRPEEAKAMLVEARDLDTLRFRADSDIAAAISRVAKDLADQDVTLLDLDGLLAAQTPGGILGSELMVDHVHLTPGANFLAAYAALEAVAEMAPAARLDLAEGRKGELSDFVRGQLLYSDQETYRLAMNMYRRKTLAPFAGQLGHEEELAAMREELYTLYRQIKGQGEPAAAYVTAIERMPLDAYLNVRYGNLLIANGRVRDAINMYQKLLEARPFDKRIREGYAAALASAGLKDETIEALTSKESPYRLSREEAMLAMGSYSAQHGMFAQAQAIYQELYRADGDNVDVLVNLAAAAYQSGNFGAMKQYLDKALSLAPDSVQAVINMGNYYAKSNEPQEAQKWFARGVELEPQNHLAHIGLGIQSIRLNEIDKGIAHIARAAELKPDFAEAYQFLATLYAQAGQTDKARRCSELAALFGS